MVLLFESMLLISVSLAEVEGKTTEASVTGGLEALAK